MSPWDRSSTVLDKRSPFDALASDYDRSFTYSAIGRAQRHAVWKVAQRVFVPGTRILELNCGTGVDAVYLAHLGLKVTALDSSSQMIAVAQDRVQRERCQNSIRLMHWAIEELDRLPPEAPYDGAFSNFGGLNCVPDLRRFGCDLARRLKPGSPVLLCLMGRYCLWELFYHPLKGQFPKAVRRLKKDGVLATPGNDQEAKPESLPPDAPSGTQGDIYSPKALPPASVRRARSGVMGRRWNTRELNSRHVAPEQTIRVVYPSVRSLVRGLQPHFRYRHHLAVGLFVPPSYLEHWASRHPRFLNVMDQIDNRVGRWPLLRNAGDHYLIHLERL
jgi:ubiquinone/menaquinone biosynthesis C-methylase UbiE